MGRARLLMIQGTASHVGKSVVTAALCRILSDQGRRVAPFKAQNMSNNSFVTADGGEIGRAQAVQAEACRLAPDVLMNPLLLKPEADTRAQVIALGRPVRGLTTLMDPRYRRMARPLAEDALRTLMRRYDIVVMEGAGSPAEVNLRRHDFVNMGLARRFRAPVLLVGDIDWGGVFAQLVGTLALLAPADRALVKALIINKFRGERKLLAPGVRWLEKRTGRPVLGVLPLVPDLGLAEEDSLARDGRVRGRRPAAGELMIDVVWLPHISNFTDFDPLKKAGGVCCVSSTGRTAMPGPIS
jgi:adenosylcobyric acid synthase